MKNYPLIFVILILFTSTLNSTALDQTQVEYRIQIHDDGSATWTVTLIGRGLQVSPDSFYAFLRKVTLIVDAAQNQTGRIMKAENLRMSADISGSYIVVKYQFKWINFSEIKDSEIMVGDVFVVEDFFSNFYGDGLINIIYPEKYSARMVHPAPYQQNITARVIVWCGTKDFKKGEPKLILVQTSTLYKPWDVIAQNIVVISLAIFSITLPLSIYILKRKRKENEKILAEKCKYLGITALENDEGKIIELLKSEGGSMLQSTLAARCGFSRSKTSNLLALLEKKGIIKRYKKGRNKVVTLSEIDKGKRC